MNEITYRECTEDRPHCSQCGSTDPESLNGDQGYTECCNEGVASGPCGNEHPEREDDPMVWNEATHRYVSRKF